MVVCGADRGAAAAASIAAAAASRRGPLGVRTRRGAGAAAADLACFREGHIRQQQRSSWERCWCCLTRGSTQGIRSPFYPRPAALRLLDPRSHSLTHGRRAEVAPPLPLPLLRCWCGMSLGKRSFPLRLLRLSTPSLLLLLLLLLWGGEQQRGSNSWHRQEGTGGRCGSAPACTAPSEGGGGGSSSSRSRPATPSCCSSGHENGRGSGSDAGGGVAPRALP